jgi:hypothetical protein
MPKIVTAKNNANTADIIYHLCMAAPGAIAQVKKMNLAKIIGLTGANVQRDAELAGKWIISEIKYKRDGFENQNIQFPSALLKTKTGDCKSFSLLYLSIMADAGHNGGFRFASYRPSGQYTHVYNFFDDRNKKLIFDACIPNLQESKRYTNIKDMKVNYLAGAPVMVEDSINGPDEITRPCRRVTIRGIAGIEFLDNGEIISEAEFIGRRGKLRDKLNKAWKGIQKAANKAGKAAGNVFKGAAKVGFAVPRQSFRILVQVNVRGFASKLKRLLDKNPDAVKRMWERFGGDYTKLFEDIKKGEKKKPLFGVKKSKPKRGVRGIDGLPYYIDEPEFNYIGDGGATAAALASAVPVIAAVVKLLKENGIKDLPEETPPAGDDDLPPDNELPPDPTAGGKNLPSDPEGEEATAFVKSGGQVYVNTKGEVVTRGPFAQPSGENLFGNKNLLILGGIAAIAAVLLLKKRK